MRRDFLVFGRPAIEEDEIAEVVATLRSGWLGTGPRVARFEEMFRQYIGAAHAVAVNSCTAALHLSHLYTVLVDDGLGKSRDRVLDELMALRIGTGVHYTALHLHPYYRERWGFARGDFPNAEHIGDRTLSLPLSAGLTDGDVGDVIDAVRAVCGG